MKILPFVCLAIAAVTGSVLQKTMTTRIALGSPKYPPHYFHKPWFVTCYMFLAMFFSVAIYMIQKWRNRKDTDEQERMSIDTVCFCAIPAFCDLTMTVLHLVSFLYLGVSISVAVASSKVIFSAVIARFALHEDLRVHHVVAIGVIMCSLVLVAVATIMGTGTPPVKASPLARVLAICAKLVAHFLGASKAALEQYLMHREHVHSTLLVGFEGFWGFIASTFVFLPIVSSMTPGASAGFFEDTEDTFQMMKNSKLILGLVIFDMFFILFLNVFHMIAVGATSALFATIFEAAQGAIVWISQIILYYSLRNTKYDEWKILGERWTNWSYLQLVGFLFAGAGVFIYNKVIHLPCVAYREQGYHNIPNTVV